MVLELGWRLVRSGPQALVHWPNLARQHMGNSEDDALSCAYAHDATLGWRLPSGCTSSGYNTDAEGFRRVPGRTAAPAGYPRHRLVLRPGPGGVRWRNLAGLSAGSRRPQGGECRRRRSSSDQTVLRTERLAARLKPPVIATSFTAADIHRSELEGRLEPAETVFRRDRRPSRAAQRVGSHEPARPSPCRWPRAWSAWSMLADEVAQRLAIQNGWYFDEVRALPRARARPSPAC